MPGKKKTDAPGDAKPPTRLDWDFATCPSEELPFCRRYEYSRENPGVVAEVEHRRATVQWSSGLYPGDWQYYEMLPSLEFFRLFPEFPATPFLSIPAKKRSARCKELLLLEGPFFVVDPERLNLDAGYPCIPNDTGIISWHEIWVMEIDRTKSKDSIKKSFARWLDSRPEISGLVEDKRGRTTDEDHLKFLAAYRLLRHAEGDWQQAADWSQEHGAAPLYAEQPEWIKARKRAARLLNPESRSSEPSGLAKHLNLAALPMDERVKLKVYISKNVDRAMSRTLKKFPPNEALTRLRELMAHEKSL